MNTILREQNSIPFTKKASNKYPILLEHLTTYLVKLQTNKYIPMYLRVTYCFTCSSKNLNLNKIQKEFFLNQLVTHVNTNCNSTQVNILT